MLVGCMAIATMTVIGTGLQSPVLATQIREPESLKRGGGREKRGT